MQAAWNFLRRCVAVFRTAIDRTTRQPVLGVFAVLNAVGMTFVAARYLISVQGITDPSGRVITGDFLAFYTAARLLAGPHPLQLYDVSAQQALEQSLVVHSNVAFQPFAYPPLLAMVLRPLAFQPYQTAFYVYVAATLLVLGTSLWTLRVHLPALCGSLSGFATTVLLVAGFHPVVRTAIGGQTSGLSLSLWLGFFAALHGGRPGLAGMWLGLLSFKPQLALLLGGALLVRREYRALVVAACVAVAHYGLAAFALGWSWPLQMLDFLSAYQPLEEGSNLFTHASLLPLFKQLVGVPMGTPIGIGSSAAIVLWVLWYARTYSGPPAALWGLVFAAALVTSPYLQYYDVALAVVPALLGLHALLEAGRRISFGIRIALAAVFVGYPVYELGAMLGFQPLAVVLLLLLTWLAHVSRSLSQPGARLPGSVGSLA